VDPNLKRVKFKDVVPQNLFGPFDTNFAQALKGEVVSGFFERTMKSGQTFYAQRIYKPILNKKSEIDSILVMLVDLTQEKKAEVAEPEARKLSSNFVELKKNLLSNRSHELLTPINGILGMNTLLEMELESQEAANLLTTQKESTLRLLSTINGLLDLNRVQADEGLFHLEKVKTNELIE